jgi:UDP-glucose 4-epimerase
MAKTVLLTGSSGFIGGYLVEELLAQGYKVIGVDNFSKYGMVHRSYDSDPNYELVHGDAKDMQLLSKTLIREQCDHFIAGAAMIGGISYFHKFAFDLMAENERILASSFEAAIAAYNHGSLKKITAMSSSMIYENTTTWPSKEGDERHVAPPESTYGFEKLAVHYFCQGALEQYQLPYTICIPFNCIGVGESRAKTDIDIKSGNVSLAMSHVVPDLIQKILKGQDPLHILGEGNQIRHYTYGVDLAKGIVASLENPAAVNESFNLATKEGHTVLELAQIIWKKINGDKPFAYVSDAPFDYDVQKRVPDVSKAKDVLGWEADTSLDAALDKVIPWIEEQVAKGTI